LIVTMATAAARTQTGSYGGSVAAKMLAKKIADLGLARLAARNGDDE
jgi:hypothetical protein